MAPFFYNSVHKVKISSKILPVVFSQRKEQEATGTYTANIFQKLKFKRNDDAMLNITLLLRCCGAGSSRF